MAVGVQCRLKTEHENHFWLATVWGGKIRRWCAGVAVPKEKERVRWQTQK